MSKVVLIDYGCHSFTYQLAARLSDAGFPIAYFANGSLESPNLRSLSGWSREHPHLITTISCKHEYGKMRLRDRLRGELEWAWECVRALNAHKPEAIIFSCIPLAAVAVIARWAKSRNIPFIYWLQDIQARAITDLLSRKIGILGRGIGFIASLCEQYLLKASKVVITIAHGHDKALPSAVRRRGSYELLQNWANVEDFPKLPHNNRWAVEHNLDKTFNVVYSGTLGLKHDLQTFISLAKAFESRPEVRIVIVSSGQAADQLSQEAKDQKLENLVLLPFQAYSAVPSVLASAGVLIAPLDAAAGSFCVPSKVLSYVCAGRPTVIAIDSSNPAAHLISSSGAGTVVAPGDHPAFVEAVESYLDSSFRRTQTGLNARAYAESTFAMDYVVDRFLGILGKAGVEWAISATSPSSSAALAST